MRIGLFSPAEVSPSQAARIEALGLDGLWIAEQPCGAGLASAPLVGLAAIAARTRRLRLGAALALADDRPPLRLAEDGATLDGISGGRLELLALPDAPGAARRAGAPGAHPRAREDLALLRRLWTETEVTWRGSARPPLERLTVLPRPVQAPHPPIRIAAASPAAVDLAAELGLPLLLSAARAPLAALVALAARYRERSARAGHEPAGVGLLYAPRGGADRAQTFREEGSASDPDLLAFPISADARKERPDAALLDALLAARAALAPDLLLVALDLGGDPHAGAGDDLERFAAEVVPALRAAADPRRAGTGGGRRLGR